MAAEEKQTILVVDDTELNIDVLIETLGHDYTVRAAVEGASALRDVAKTLPDLILLDIMMPGMDGFEVCSRLKQDEATRDIPVIFLTVLDENVDEARGLSLGAVDCITKPFNPAIVRARVRTHLELKKHKDHLEGLVTERTAELKTINEQLKKEITERKRAHEALQKSEARYRLLLESILDDVYVIDSDGRFAFVNDVVAERSGHPKEWFIGRHYLEVAKPEYRELVQTRVDACFRGERVPPYEVLYLNTSGRELWIESHVTPLYEGEEITGLLAINREITERKKMEKELRKHRADLEQLVTERTVALTESEKRYRELVDNALVGVYQNRFNGEILYHNDCLVHMLGFESLEEIKASKSRLPYKNLADWERFIRILKETGKAIEYETEFLARDGGTVNVLISASLNEDIVSGMVLDITDRKKVEDALRESEERYRTAIEHSNDGVAIIQGDVHLYVNRRFVEMFGYDRPEDIIGKPVTITVHPDDIPKVMQINMRRQRGVPGIPRYEFKGITRETKAIHIEVSAASIMYRGAPVSLVYLRDVTERKRAEEALKQSHLELERLNRAKTKAVSHISHELKTPLAVIQGNIRILKRTLENSPFSQSVRANMEILERNFKRLLGISKQTNEIFRVSQELEAGVLLSDIDRLGQRMEDLSEIPPDIRTHWSHLKRWMSQYMSGSPLYFQSIDFYPFLQSVVEKAKQRASHRTISYIVEGENDLFIFMDPGILNDVLGGILKNAIENTPDGGLIKTSVEQKGDNIDVHIADYGVGIAEDDLHYLFDGLYDTRETDLYTSKKPYYFGAGGKGFDLLRTKMYGIRFGFEVSVESRKCAYIFDNLDVCPGNISECRFLKSTDDCARSGGTTFTVSFPLKRTEEYEPSQGHEIDP